ncbi:dead end protein 1 isoform X1 [Hippocampus comes]|uniref:dead end protein 1 isoform X1 n=1 Tax=Hippocampus comes TaxID=109280 RepID=UPI00094F0234|nr:PREDICTED: dead end protein homolog 1 isoform X1 [Hippocampus comes]
MDNQIQVLNVERLQARETWLKTTKTKVTQVNGQRKYGGPPEVWMGPAPGINCEVFINNIPQDVYEDLLIPLFSSVGPLWEFRLMMNFSGQNRGFAYAKYGSADVAKNAIRQLHGHMLLPGAHLIVCLSTEKRHVYLTNLPATFKQDELLKVLHEMVEGVESLSLKSGPEIEGVSAIVVFSSHYAASMAKRVLMEGFLRRFGIRISVQWQYPIKVKDELHLPQKYKSLKASTPKLPSNMANVSKILAQPPPTPQNPSLIPADFCRAVGGPVAPKSTSHEHLSPALSASPVTFLQKCCEMSGIGLPQFEFFCSGDGPDEFLHLTFMVSILGLGVFPGEVRILPGPTATTTIERAREAAAQQLLKSVIGLKVFLR